MYVHVYIVPHDRTNVPNETSSLAGATTQPVIFFSILRLHATTTSSTEYSAEASLYAGVTTQPQ